MTDSSGAETLGAGAFLVHLALGLELALAGLGFWLLWSRVLCGAARRRRPALPAFAPWPGSGPDFALYVILVVLVTLTLVSLAGFFLRRAPGLGEDPGLIIGAGALHTGLLLSMAAAALALRHGLLDPAARRRTEDGAPAAPARPARGPRIGGALSSGTAVFLIALGPVLLLTNASEACLRWAGIPEKQQELLDRLEAPGPLWFKGALLVVATLVVPFSEELFFRGALFRFARTSRLPRWAALVLPSLLFGLLHVDFGHADLPGLIGLLPLTLLAVVFSLGYERTGNIGTCIVAHALFNLNTFILVAAGVNT